VQEQLSKDREEAGGQVGDQEQSRQRQRPTFRQAASA
jgi:hypothetical protein